MAVDNRARLTTDLGAEHQAQHLAVSNDCGYTDTSAWLQTDVHPVTPPVTKSSLFFLIFLVTGGGKPFASHSPPDVLDLGFVGSGLHVRWCWITVYRLLKMDISWFAARRQNGVDGSTTA
jgi:hypothetical protein